MKKVFVLKWKYDRVYFDASTPELEEQAYVKAVDLLHNELDAYSDLDDADIDHPWKIKQLAWLHEALDGDAKAAKRLMTARQDYEHEGFSIEPVE